MDEDVKQKVIHIIGDYLGDSTAQLYKEFYQNKDDSLILISIKELLIEYLGEAPTQQILIEKGLIASA
jgi:hypothetical protein